MSRSLYPIHIPYTEPLTLPQLHDLLAQVQAYKAQRKASAAYSYQLYQDERWLKTEIAKLTAATNLLNT